jgi:hypothetical protein
MSLPIPGQLLTKEEWRRIRVNHIIDAIVNKMGTYDVVPSELVDEYNELVALDITEDTEPLVVNISLNALDAESFTKALSDEKFIESIKRSWSNG